MSTLQVNLKHTSYEIIIERGIFSRLGKEIKSIYKGNKIQVVTDDNLYNLYGDKLRQSLEMENFEVDIIVVEHGEKSKSFEVLQELYNRFLDFKLTRSDLIVAFGGGVIGDLTGFAASTYLRGIPFIQVPTSLLAQIDSSIGGKVAINLERGKNLVGSFYHPKKVFIDSNLLNTLPEKFLYDGMGEVIKYACIKDSKLFSKLINFNSEKELLSNIDDIIYNCCYIKKLVVEEDEKDTSLRMILNFGHTIGHAIEKYFNYEKYTHGEAVAMGMYIITLNSEKLGLTEQGTSEKIKYLLNKYNLKENAEDMEISEVMETISLDKKNMGKKLNIILLNKVGDAFIKTIDKEEIRNFV